MKLNEDWKMANTMIYSPCMMLKEGKQVLGHVIAWSFFHTIEKQTQLSHYSLFGESNKLNERSASQHPNPVHFKSKKLP